MAVLGLVLSIFGLGAACWLLLSLAVYALPVCAALTAALAVLHGGAGIVGAIVVGVLVGGAVLALGRAVFATVRPPLLKALIGLLYAVPAAIAGYQLSLALAKIATTDDGWGTAFAVGGAVLIGVTAFSRMTLFAPPGGPGGTWEHRLTRHGARCSATR